MVDFSEIKVGYLVTIKDNENNYYQDLFGRTEDLYVVTNDFDMNTSTTMHLCLSDVKDGSKTRSWVENDNVLSFRSDTDSIDNKTKKIDIVTLEGIDGSGKDTQAKMIADRLGYTIGRLPYYENETGSIIRKMVDSGKKNVSEERFQSLMLANYIEYFDDFVFPELEKGNSVVITRAYESMRAYANHFGINETLLDNMIEGFKEYVASKNYNMDTILIDIPVEESLRRINSRGEGVEEVFENDTVLSDVRDSFLQNIDFDMVVDGTGTKERVYADIVKII